MALTGLSDSLDLTPASHKAFYVVASAINVTFYMLLRQQITNFPSRICFPGSLFHTWHVIGPILTQKYTVIAFNIRGMGQSTNPSSYDFTSTTVSEDLKGVLEFWNITQIYLVAHDKGNGQAAALNAKYRSLVKRAVYRVCSSRFWLRKNRISGAWCDRPVPKLATRLFLRP